MTELERNLAIAVGLLAAALVVLAWLHLRQLREVWRLRERCAHEASSHYLTYTRLQARERQIGTLAERLRGLEEIATASAIGAQLYQALMADIRGPPAPGDAS